ncbi:nucleoporin Nup186/Nup192/Nup205 [Crucibulum laeve]|uniref:Nucleoporin Nup186/Nup192/Nup205 n=1 Tax=Crucibulum laeve TaxID=68775 RepID=A0A5C3LXQ1_9AGAR|nr:nucleoporin Nup186/Nup192/Nup205 [Crucibulum laeve]
MESIHILRELLAKVLSNNDSHYDEQELFNQLMVQKPRLLSLLDFGQRNQQEQREIESGKTVVNGKSVAVNADFARQAIALSHELGISERFAATLLSNTMQNNTNIGAVNCLETTVNNFHKRRRELMECLLYLCQATELAQAPNAPKTLSRISAYFSGELIHGVVAGKEASLPKTIIAAIEHLDAGMARAEEGYRNAATDTVIPSGPGNISFGSDVLSSRLESLKYERRTLATALCILARLSFVAPQNITHITEWLSNNPDSAMSHYFLTALLLAFNPTDSSTEVGSRSARLIVNPEITTFMTKKLAPSTAWKDPGLKATILLKWTLSLTEARHKDDSLENRAGFRTEDLETQIWNAVQGDTFHYLAVLVAQVEQKRGTSPASSLITLLSSEQTEQRDSMSEEFKLMMLTVFENLLRSLITHASSELRKIKQKQEDLVITSARERNRNASSRYTSSIALGPEKPGPPPRHDIAMLYTFIGLLYSALPPERALQFWGSSPSSEQLSYLELVESSTGRLPSFLQWAIWSTPVQDLTMLAALYDMLSGLSKGQQCSELAYNFMARGAGEVIPGSSLSATSSGGPTVSWIAIFNLLESWAVSTSNTRGPPSQQSLGFGQGFGSLNQFAPPPPPPSHQINIGPKDVLLAQSFLRLLSTVVTYSVPVRTTISGHAQFRAIPTLVSLIPLGIPLELKGALFETLSAFCEPGAGAAGVEICKAVWTLMERLEVINVRVGSNSGFGALTTAKGVELELEQIESAHRLYPATIPFLKLLSTLVHTPKRIPLRDRAADTEPVNTIPESLGQSYRLPGVGPFTSFVIDNVFANIPNREYARPSDRWQINNLCLCYIERALASFDLESLVNAVEDTSLRGETLIPLLVHPGYDIMQRLLTNSPLQESLLSYIVDGVDAFDKDVMQKQPFFRDTIARVLRIVHRVLEIEDIFLDVLIPILSDFDSTPFVGPVHSQSYYTKFDQALSFGPQFVPALAAYMTYPAHSELVLLSVKIISILSLSTSFSTLVTLIERSKDSDRIIGAFARIISSDSMDNITQSEEIAEQITGAGAPEIDETDGALEQPIRLAALDLLIQDTDPDRPYPNIAHFLLFGGSRNEHQIQDPHALGGSYATIHALLELVNAGVPRLKGKQKEREEHRDVHVQPLFMRLPELAERCYRVIHQLCIHPRTSDFTTRYLRTRDDFFARHLKSIPSQVPPAQQDSPIQVIYGDGSRVITTVPALSAFIRLRSFVFDLVALELHILTNRGHFKGISELLDILFGSDFGYEDNEFPVFREVGQSHMRIIDFLQSLMFEWADSLTVNDVSLQFLSHLNLQTCVRKDSTGCGVVDRTALLLLLAAGRRALHAQGAIMNASQELQINAEATYILESCAVENHRRKVTHALVAGFEAWRRLLDMALTKCFDRLPHDRRENMLFDLLHVLPEAIRSGNLEESTSVLLSETVLSSITKLREDRRHQIILQSVGGDAEAGSLPAERLYSILRNILEGILESNHVELVRGNLYASLINFIHLIGSPREEPISATIQGDSLSLTVTLSSFNRSQALVPFDQKARTQNPSSSLQSGSLAVIKSTMDRLTSVVARDAIDGTEVWKTIAFMLLDALVQLSSQEKQHIILNSLGRHGILANFIRGIKESDLRLQSVLKADPDDLNPLYVYEAKMSLFIRMSQTRLGAERLLEAQLMSILAQCDYLDARPEADQSFMDQDSFLPSAVQRYHQLFMPALQAVDGILAVLGSKHTTATNQALEFLTAHGSTVVILLKNETDYTTLALLEEIHLIVTLCASVLPTVPKTELLSANSGFGAIHAAILSLGAKCLGRRQYFSLVVPQTDVEIQNANIFAFGFGSETKFDVSVRQKDRLLRKAIVAYIGAAGDFTEPEINLVLSPITNVPRHEERAHFSATVPSVGDVLGALDELCNDLSETLKQIADLTAELANKDHIGVENAQEVLRDIHPTLLQELDIDQKRTLICQELDRIKRATKREAKTLLDTTEMLLLLIWRHLDYYAEPRHMNTPPARASLTNAMRLLATTEPETFRAEVATKLAPALQRLSLLDLNHESLGKDWQVNQAYIEIMCRRLRDSASLHDESTMEDGE